MKRKLKAKSSVYNFLKSNGVLEKGTHEEIQSARKEYWNEYKQKWRKEQRKKEKEITISLDRDELKEISIEAKRHKLSRTKFIKRAAIAYINKSFIVPDILEVKRISQLLSMTYNSVRELLEENKVNLNEGRNALETIRKLEREILPSLHNPKALVEYILQYIKKNSEIKSQLLNLINSL